MKNLLVIAGLFVLALWVIGCGGTTATPTVTLAPMPTEAAPTTAPTDAPAATAAVTEAPTGSAPTDEPAPIAAKPAPTAAVDLGETVTYSDPDVAFALDYPTSWSLTPVADDIKSKSVIYSVTLLSWKPDNTISREGIPEGETKIDVLVYKNNAASPEEALAMRKEEFASAGLGQTIEREETWTLPGGLTATRLVVTDMFGTAEELVTAINGKTLVLGGVGDPELFDAIATTLREPS